MWSALALSAPLHAHPPGCDPPDITAEPHSVAVFAGGTLSLVANADGTLPLAYQWRKNGVPVQNDGRIDGATANVLMITPLETLDSGIYDVVITNACGTAVSHPATLQVSCFSPSFTGQLIAPDGAANDQLGQAVAASGDTVVVGVPFDDNARGSNAGSVCVWIRIGDAWTLQQRLIAAEGAADDRFGAAVAISGNTILVGAPQGDVDFTNTGAAYVFTRSGGGVWTQQARLAPADRAANDRFGAAVALDGNLAVVGATHEESPGQSDRGAVYTFTRTAGAWTEQQKLLASDALNNDQFGAAVAAAAGTIAVGAQLHDVGSASDSGAVYVFENAGGGWVQTQILTPKVRQTLANFGCAVATTGTLIAIGAERDFVGGARTGAAYVFSRDGGGGGGGGGWVERDKLAGGGQFDDFFGSDVAIAGSSIVVGARNADPPFFPNTGLGYFFAPHGQGWTLLSTLAPIEPSLGMALGTAVAAAGDTVLLSAPLDNAGAVDSGSVYIFDISNSPPRVIDNPDPVRTCRVANVSFSIQFADEGLTLFTWRRNGVALENGPTPSGSVVSGANTPMLSISSAHPADRGVYDVVVANSCGPTVSAAAELFVCTADWTCDGTTNATDVSDFINDWFDDLASGSLVTDVDANGVVNSTDVSQFINFWFDDTAAGC